MANEKFKSEQELIEHLKIVLESEEWDAKNHREQAAGYARWLINDAQSFIKNGTNFNPLGLARDVALHMQQAEDAEKCAKRLKQILSMVQAQPLKDW